MKKLYISLSALLATGFAAQAQDGMGIGNSNPQEMLDVTGAIKIGGTIVGAADAGSIRWNGTNFQGYDGTQWVNLDESGGSDADWTVSGNNQYSAVSGNVGIGTTSPTAKLDVDGQIRMRTGATTGYVPVSDANGVMTWTDPNTVVTPTVTNTLDAAYDQGGAGAGREIDATDGAVAINGGDGFMVTGTVGSGPLVGAANGIADGPGTRMFFNPNRAAFRAGHVNGTEWDATNIGSYSVAFGYNNIASGSWSAVIGGGGNTASGAHSTATGNDNTAAGGWSFAAGNLNTTGPGIYSIALGSANSASGQWATAIGGSNVASGMGSTALGLYHTTPSLGEIAMGLFSTTYTATSATSWSATDRLLVLGNGQNPSNRSNALVIYKDGTMNINDAYDMPTADGSAGQVLTTNGSGVTTWQTPGAGASIADADNDTKIQVEETGDEDKIRFDTGNVERMIIDNSGNVGIGDNSPSNRLHVSVNSGSGLSVPVLVQNTGAVNAGGTGSGIGFSNMGNIDNAKAILYNERTADYGIGKLHVLMNNSNNTAAATLADARMTILSDGNVGIGTTSPTSELEVSGQLKVSGSSPAARLLLTGYSTTEGGELQLNGGSNYTSSAYALDNYEGRLRILRTTNANGSGGSGTTEVISVKGTNQVGIGNIGGNAWPAESNLIIGDNGGLEGGQIQFYNANGAGTSWFLDVYGNEFRFLTGNNITGSGSPKSIITNTGNLIMAGSVRASNGQYLFEDGCSNYLKLQADGNAVIYYGNNGFSGWASGTNCSDMRLKENIRDLESVLSVIQDLDVIRYNYKEETGLPSGPQVGVNAQQLFKYFPEMVYYNEEKDQYVVYYDKLTTLLIKGMQEMIENLKTSNASLSDSYMSLKTELSEMKDWIQYKSQTSNE